MFYRCLALFTAVYAVICDLLTLDMFSHGIRNVRLYEYYIISYYLVCCFDMRVKTL